MSLDVSLHDNGKCVFEWNITHNLAPMARAAGFYTAAWHPVEAGFTKASDLSIWLEQGILNLVRRKAEMVALNPHNGWGDYDGLLDFCILYAVACIENPDAEIRVSV